MSSMTPPIRMVSGPVEPIVRDIASQLGASIAELGFPVGLGIAPPEEMCLKAARGIVALYGHTLTAAPVREEGGAVLADACQTAARSYAETGDDYMVGLLLKAATALATREEAPAAAGEAPEPPAHLSSEAAYGWSCGYEAALRAQPPAREDAQPVAWQRRFYSHSGDPGPWEQCAEPEDTTNLRPARIIEYRPLYTHPAPDALRVAVEALDEMADTDPDEGTSWFHDRANKARADIAALQAEQGTK